MTVRIKVLEHIEATYEVEVPDLQYAVDNWKRILPENPIDEVSRPSMKLLEISVDIKDHKGAITTITMEEEV